MKSIRLGVNGEGLFIRYSERSSIDGKNRSIVSLTHQVQTTD